MKKLYRMTEESQPMTLAMICKVYTRGKVSARQVAGRLSQGWDLRDAVMTPFTEKPAALPRCEHIIPAEPKTRGRKAALHALEDGGRQMTLREWAKESPQGISLKILAARIHIGWTLQRALSEPLVKRGRRNFLIDGKDVGFSQLRRMAQIHGVGPSTLKMRLQRNWPADMAIEKPVGSIGTNKGISTSEARRIGRIAGKDYWEQHKREAVVECSDFYARVGRGWSLDKALHTPPMNNHDRAVRGGNGTIKRYQEERMAYASSLQRWLFLPISRDRND